MEFFLNEFPWIQRIQRIMAKSQSGMVTKGITQLATNTLPVLVIQSAFSLLQLGGYLLSITTLNRYQPRDSSRKIFFTTTSSNTSILSYGMSLVTILFLDLIMVHWIRRIQRNPFRKNSIARSAGFLVFLRVNFIRTGCFIGNNHEWSQCNFSTLRTRFEFDWTPVALTTE